MFGFSILALLRVLCLLSLLAAVTACSPGEEERSRGDGAETADRGSGERSGGPEARSGRAGGDGPGQGRRRGGGDRRGGPRGGPSGGMEPAGESGVPVEVAAVKRNSISSFFESSSTLEAENEVDVVARVAGPIVRLEVEEGDRVENGQVLAQLDDRELRAQLEAAEVRLEEARASFQRTRSLFEQELVSQDLFDQARASADTSRADAERLRVQLDYTTITAPFSGLLVRRYVKFAEFVQNGAQLFRLSDFDPLLAPIQVPERHLPRLATGQRARLGIEAYGERAFEASVLRIRPVVDAESGTVEVTLEVRGEGLLRPGMFATVELEMERRENVLLAPKTALALDSLKPTVFVAAQGEEGTTVAERRELVIGLRNDRWLEVVEGLAEGESVVVVGQDGLADGTPLELPSAAGEEDGAGSAAAAVGQGQRGFGPRGYGGPGGSGAAADGERQGPPGFLMDLDWDDPAQVERLRERMRERGLSESQIEERLERMKRRFAGGGGDGEAGGERARRGGAGPGSGA